MKRNSTKTRTSSITTAQMTIAVAALSLANAFALATVPINPGQLAAAAVSGPKCGVNRVVYSQQSCAVGMYKGARVTCQDNTYTDVGLNYCVTQIELQKFAADACVNHCTPPLAQPLLRSHLTLSTDLDSPQPSNLLMGSLDQVIARFDLGASAAEDLRLQDFVVSLYYPTTSTAQLSVVRNIRIFDGNVQVGAAVPFADGTFTTSTFGQVRFRDIGLTIPKGHTKVLTVKADISPYEQVEASGMRVQPIILKTDYDALTLGVQHSVTALGTMSGNVLSDDDITFYSRQGFTAMGTLSDTFGPARHARAPLGNVEANEFSMFRSKLAVAWAADTPSGAAVGSVNQLVAKVVVTNAANVGNYNATVKFMNFNLYSNIIHSTSGTLSVYKDALGTPSLAVSTFRPHSMYSGIQNFDDRDFTDVNISSGASKTFLVTLDTSDAQTNNQLSVNVASPQSQTEKGMPIMWSDGVLNDIIAYDNILPLPYKVLTY